MIQVYIYVYVITPQRGIYLIYKLEPKGHRLEGMAYKSDIARGGCVITNLCNVLKPYFKGIIRMYKLFKP